MERYACAEASRKLGEDIVGSGTNHQTYVLVEYPTPWAANALESEGLPDNLKSLIAQVEQSKRSVRFLLINDNQTRKKKSRKVLIYEKKEKGLIKGYGKQEFEVENIDQVAEVVSKGLSKGTKHFETDSNKTRDILVCTHGNHDLCCGKYGAPFYNQALITLSELSLGNNVRMWRASHFGGHRFAPTMIDLPEGRYYGVLDQESFKSIITRSGDVSCLKKVYRGWGILPTQIQALEREMILVHGWDWFDYKVRGTIVGKYLDDIVIQADITFQKPNGSKCTYRAELVKDESKTTQLKGSCGARMESVFIKYSVENLRLHSVPVTQIRRYRDKVAS
ncbi:MAG: sucrase ferredoxin [Coleofasciculaceae cyanobacterium]